MCGRFTLHRVPHAVALQFGLAREPAYRASFNIAPGMPVLAIRAESNHARSALVLRWDLVPSWARDPAIGRHLINARAEHLPERPAFRRSLHARRCIIPADGYYLWHATGEHRQPWYVRPQASGLFGFAGLYEWWEGPAGRIGSCVIVTTAANAALAPLNDRMPAILPAGDYAHWLDPDHPDPTVLATTLRPAPSNQISIHRVAALVDDLRNDGPELIAPATTAETRGDDLF